MTFSTITRRWYWRHVRRHDGEICKDCGRPTVRALGDTYWFAPNTLWNRLHPERVGILCARCFTADAREQGVSIGWVAAETQHIAYGGPVSDALEVSHDSG